MRELVRQCKAARVLQAHARAHHLCHAHTRYILAISILQLAMQGVAARVLLLQLRMEGVGRACQSDRRDVEEEEVNEEEECEEQEKEEDETEEQVEFARKIRLLTKVNDLCIHLCVCVRKREGEKEGEGERERERERYREREREREKEREGMRE